MAKKSSSTPKVTTPATSPDLSEKPAPKAKRTVKAPAKSKPAATAATSNGNGSSEPHTAPKAPKKTRSTKPARPAATRKTEIAAVVPITTEDVSLRAYFLSEKRRNEGLPGSPHGDWIEAERQLQIEASAVPAKRRRKAA